MSRSKFPIDAVELDQILTDLRLPSIREDWRMFAEQAADEGWPVEWFLQVLLEHEHGGRCQRRIARYLSDSELIPGKVLGTFDFTRVPELSEALVMTLAEGGAWLESGRNILLFGPSGVGKSHLACGIGRALVDREMPVLYSKTTKMIQRLQRANRDLELEKEIVKLDRYRLLILDDIAYSSKDRDQADVLFELIAHRYERRSMLIASNKTFKQWDGVFPDRTMALAAVDRIVHDSTLIEMNAESYRKQASLKAKAPNKNASAGGKGKEG